MSRNARHIKCQLLYVLATKCYLQAVHKQQRILSSTRTSGANGPHSHYCN